MFVNKFEKISLEKNLLKRNSLKKISPRSSFTLHRSLSIMLTFALCFGLCLTCGYVASSANSLTTAAQAQQPRRPLPKPKGGARGFEQYAGRDASSRLIAAGATRGAGIPRKPIAPMEGIALDARPFFLWEPGLNTQTYKFMLYDGDVYADAKAPVVWQTETKEPQLVYPADAPALKPGHLYSWRVAAPQSDIRSGNSGSLTVGFPVRFFVLVDEDAQPVKQAISDAKLGATPATLEDKLKHAQLLAEYGVWYDALHIARELVAENPQNDDVQAFYASLIAGIE
ncbi:MAG: DUF928 domain-containing protein [Pyrinomonadaceae bacterium MAG19_C2-C3]|nr:DUF928 domain-containing protein [Pyrinomonadaceae bacterium MAG19_C2-C3]